MTNRGCTCKTLPGHTTKRKTVIFILEIVFYLYIKIHFWVMGEVLVAGYLEINGE